MFNPRKLLHIILFSSLFAITYAATVHAGSTEKHDRLQQMQHVLGKRKNLQERENPQLKGWLVEERKELIETNQELKVLLLDLQELLLRFGGSIQELKSHVIQLIDALTWMVYIICGVTVIFAFVYVKKNC